MNESPANPQGNPQGQQQAPIVVNVSVQRPQQYTPPTAQGAELRSIGGCGCGCGASNGGGAGV